MLRSVKLVPFALAGALAVAAAAAVACGPGRTSAATQTTPAAFDASKSDAKAIELVDAMVAASGGADAWTNAHEVRFSVKMVADGSTIVDVRHTWDKWNGRHHFQNTNPTSGQVTTTVYEIYGSLAFATAGKQDVPTSTVKEWVPGAKERLYIDSYLLFMVFKLKDPGVVLKYDGERADEATPDRPSYDVVKVSFEPGIAGAGDTYFVVISKETKLPAWIEMVPAGKPEDYRLAYKWDDWQDVAGVKLAMKRVNLGHEGEQIVFSNVELRKEPEEELYVKVLR